MAGEVPRRQPGKRGEERAARGGMRLASQGSPLLVATTGYRVAAASPCWICLGMWFFRALRDESTRRLSAWSLPRGMYTCGRGKGAIQTEKATNHGALSR